MRRLDPKWECGACGVTHDDEDDARDCCRPGISEVYVCPVCQDKHDTEDSALDCCEDELGEVGAGEPTAAELGAQGQMRLGYAP